MDESKRENRAGCIFMAGAGILVLLPVLYVFGIGPTVWLTVRWGLPEWVIATFYDPLVILAKWPPAFRDFLQWYMDWWAG